MRRLHTSRLNYILFLTANQCQEDMVLALKEGADDFIAKPFDYEVLHARVLVGARILALQQQVLAQEKGDRRRAEDQSRSHSLGHLSQFGVPG